MSSYIEEMVLMCNTCLEKRNANPKEPLMPHEVPERPWQVVATDLFSWDGQNFVTVTDYYSRYFWVYPLRNTLAGTVIQQMKVAFSHHGIPEKLVSDNGPQYSCDEFAKFSKQYGFIHTTSNPTHAQSKGLAEKTVQTVKHIFGKCKADRKDPYSGILEYLNTPLECNTSPAQALMSRRLRSIVPSNHKQLQPKPVNYEQFRNQLVLSRQKQNEYYSRQSTALKPLEMGETVRVKKQGTWVPSTITGQVDPRSYTVKTTDGREYRRNRCDLIKSRKATIPEFEPPTILSRDHESATPFAIKQSHTKVLGPPMAIPTINSDNSSTGDPKSKTSDSVPASTSKSEPYVSGRVVKPRSILSL
eukprot:XP_011415131.1 PREDICTED: uncharacterized protein K02A2.6-like [Crassostrea gigas]